ncbi:UTRA domain-containing protein [Streptomyces sp. H34-S5]|nr:UTRA domain-containing protein [Streptomyces sp. H34-S5]MCY0942285.1 UTRA domain-containing protein [Streptomyces sp. H34-AA3]MCZ4080718.1 UTRA domain-containing protein [Streptomyces sp. H34-S5]
MSFEQEWAAQKQAAAAGPSPQMRLNQAPAEPGYGPARFREEIRSRMPGPDEAARLGLTAGTPVVLVCRTAYTAEGKAVEVNEMVLDSAAYVLEYEFDAR